MTGGNLGTVTTTGTSKSDSDLTCGTKYTYSVRTYGDGSNWAPEWGNSSSVSVTTRARTPNYVRFSSSSYSVDEGSGRSITVTLSRSVNRSLNIPITISGTANSTVSGLSSGDLTISSGSNPASFTINAGQVSNYSHETLNLGIGSPLPAGISRGTPSTARLAISDDDNDCNGRPTNTAPELIGPSSKSYAENGTGIVADYDATDDDGDDLTFSILGTDSSLFRISSSSGSLSFRNSPNYESPSDSQVVTVTVTNIDESGSVSLSSTSPQVGIEITATLRDPDGSISNESWQWESSPSGTISWNDITGATESTYTPVTVDQGRRLRATVSYSDGHGSGKSASSSRTAEVEGPPPSPASPRIHTKTTGDGTITLDWNDVDNATGYIVQQ